MGSGQSGAAMIEPHGQVTRLAAMEEHNHFLNALSIEDLTQLRPSLARVTVQKDQHLAEPGRAVENVYLPIRCVISVVAVMSDGRSVETRTAGCETGVGLLHALGSPISFERVTCQIEGESWRLPLSILAAAAARSATLSSAIVRHAQATLLQTAQATACNTLHTAEERLCRWLLLTRERTASDVLPLTQEHLSVMLGVQRTTITAIASDLQARGLVSYRRGRITLLDKPGLLANACECYEAIEGAVQRVLTDTA